MLQIWCFCCELFSFFIIFSLLFNFCYLFFHNCYHFSLSLRNSLFFSISNFRNWQFLLSLTQHCNYFACLLSSADQRNLGMSMRVERSSLDQVRKRFEQNKKKLDEKKKEYDFEERIKELKEEV